MAARTDSGILVPWAASAAAALEYRLCALKAARVKSKDAAEITELALELAEADLRSVEEGIELMGLDLVRVVVVDVEDDFGGCGTEVLLDG